MLMRCRHWSSRWAIPLSCILNCLFFLPSVRGGATNRTIDDNFGDSFTSVMPTYAPPINWTYGPSCPSCGVNEKLNLSLAEIFDQGWHDTTANPGEVKNVTLNFTGTAIWVFCIIPNQAAGITTTANFTFELDGVLNGRLYHPPDASNTILYNHSVYSVTGLPNVPHTLVMSPTAGAADGADITHNSLMLFDYAIYTFDDTPSSPPPTAASEGTPKGAIVGGVLGGAATLLLLTALLYMLYRRRARRAHLFEQKLRAQRFGGAALPSEGVAAPPPFGLDVTRTMPLASMTSSTSPLNPGLTQGSINTGVFRSGLNNAPGGPDSPYMTVGIPSGKHIASTRRELLLSAVVPASASNTNEHGASTSRMVQNDADEPRSAVLLERVETLQAEVELLRAGYAAPPAYE